MKSLDRAIKILDAISDTPSNPGSYAVQKALRRLREKGVSETSPVGKDFAHSLKSKFSSTNLSAEQITEQVYREVDEYLRKNRVK